MHDTSTNSAKSRNWLEIRGDDCLLRIRIQPRSSRECIDGVRDGRLLVRVTAPPIDGAANQRLIRLLSHALGVPKSDVSLLRGTKNRDKDVWVRGAAISAAQLAGEI
ncbi:MAG: DUF167 domain-containing protein [Steroidobacteraceae bacterium]